VELVVVVVEVVLVVVVAPFALGTCPPYLGVSPDAPVEREMCLWAISIMFW
jgi:hypothetical protein